MELSRQGYKYLCFEILRLRTRFDNENDNAVKVRIAKRYREVVTEFNKRSSNWFWTEHELDRIIKAVEELKKEDDWCSGKGGVWKTINGNRICIFPGESAEDSFKYRMFQIDNSKDELVKTVKSKYETQDPSRAHFILQDGGLIAMGMVGRSHDDIKESFKGDQKLVHGDGTKFFMRSTDAMRVKTSTIGGASNIMVEVWTSQDITSKQWKVLEDYVEHTSEVSDAIVYYDVMGSNGLSEWSNVIENASGKDISQIEGKYNTGRKGLGKSNNGKDKINYKVSLVERWERRGYEVREKKVKKQEEEAGKWVTLENGQKVFIREGESFNEAISKIPKVKNVERKEYEHGFGLKIDLEKKGMKGEVKAILKPDEEILARFDAYPTREGFGSVAYKEIERRLKEEGWKEVNVTPDSGSTPFWLKQGFKPSKKTPFGMILELKKPLNSSSE